MATVRWDDVSIGPGPIALSIDRMGQEGAHDLLFAASRSSPAVVAISLEHLAEFLNCFNTRLFVSADVASIHHRLLKSVGMEQRRELALAALWTLTKEGRWVNLRLLDRQVRHARNPNEYKLRDWPIIAQDWAPDDAGDRGAWDQQRPGRDEKRECTQVLNVFERLWSEAIQLGCDANSVLEPAFELSQLPPEKAEAMHVQAEAWFQKILAHRRSIGLDGPGAEEISAPQPAPRQTAIPPLPLGHRVEVWASVCLKQMPGLVVDTSRLPALLGAAAAHYQSASRLLFQKPELRNCFKWSGEEVARDDKGLPQYNGPQLAKWLNNALHKLCDCQNRPADIHRNAEGRPPFNPEHWGIWPGCDNTLHAWRQVFRMADVARIARREEVIQPSYEMVPALCSNEPNLNVYRSLKVPVFKPRSGHIFVAGQLPELRARCLAAICVRRGGWQNSRLRNYLLGQHAPIDVAAAEMFTGDTIAEAERGFTSAISRFSTLLETDRDNADYWLRLTHVLLDTVPLGLPTSLLTRLLQNDYGLGEMTEPEVKRLKSILVEEVAYELKPFLEDATLDVVTARLGLGFKEGLRQLLNIDDPDTTGASLRNALQEDSRHPINRLVNEHLTAMAEDFSSMPRQGTEWFEYRGASLAGRVTNQAASATVRRAELLMSVEDVMLAVAHDISAAGYCLLGLTDNEFVLEVPVNKASEPELTQIARLTQGASRQILGVAASVRCEAVEMW